MGEITKYIFKGIFISLQSLKKRFSTKISVFLPYKFLILPKKNFYIQLYLGENIFNLFLVSSFAVNTVLILNRFYPKRGLKVSLLLAYLFYFWNFCKIIFDALEEFFNLDQGKFIEIKKKKTAINFRNCNWSKL